MRVACNARSCEALLHQLARLLHLRCILLERVHQGLLLGVALPLRCISCLRSLLVLHLDLMRCHCSLLRIEERGSAIVIKLMVARGRWRNTGTCHSVTAVLMCASVLIEVLCVAAVSLCVRFIKFSRRLDATSCMTLITVTADRLERLL